MFIHIYIYIYIYIHILFILQGQMFNPAPFRPGKVGVPSENEIV